MLRVAIATHFPRDPAAPRGGVEAVSVTLVQALAALGDLEVHVVTADTACRAVERTVWEGTTVHRLPAPAQPLLCYATGAGRRAVQQYLCGLQPDIVHAHDTYGLMLKGFAGPRVFTVHGFIHEDTRLAGGRWARLRARLWERVEKAGWAEQPHIVSISPYVRERLRGLATGTLHDIGNPVSAACFAIRRRVYPDTVFSAAALCARKNTLGLIEAADRLRRLRPEVQVRLAGGCPDPAYRERVRQTLDARGMAGAITLLGGIPAEAVRAERASAAVFALVSLEEGAPMGVAEAMAAGVPVVASNRCGIPYMVRNGETGFLVDPLDPQQIAARLHRVLADGPLREAMGQQARQNALERYHPHRVAVRTRQVYLEAVARYAPGRNDPGARA